MCYLWCPKIIEGSIFRGRDNIQNLLSDLDLGGPDDLRSDLRGRLRPSEAKIGFFSDFTKTVISARFENMRKVFQRFFDAENVLFQMNIITLAAKCGNSHNRYLKKANFSPIFQPLKTDFQKSFQFFLKLWFNCS